MSSYRHTQPATLVLWVLVPVVLAMAWLVFAVTPHPIAVAALAVLVICLAMFFSLTVRVDADAVRLRFGAGPISRSFPLSAIRGARVVRNPWYYGWGIRWFPGGWLFNVSGLDAVELEMLHGRRYRIGTDEPEELLSAIRKVRERAG